MVCPPQYTGLRWSGRAYSPTEMYRYILKVFLKWKKKIVDLSTLSAHDRPGIVNKWLSSILQWLCFVDGRASYEGMAGLGPPCIVVDRPYLPITFLLQVGKLLLYKKVKFIGMVCLPTVHRCLKSVHRLPESNKLLTWIKRILPFKAYSTLHTNKSVQQQGGSYNKHNFQLQNFTYKKLSILKNLDFCWGSFKVELTHVTAQEYPQGIFGKNNL